MKSHENLKHLERGIHYKAFILWKKQSFQEQEFDIKVYHRLSDIAERLALEI